jgi:Uma2 family endonuclease
MATIERPARRWTVEDYHRAGDAGVFGPEERLELIEGAIFCVSPQSPPHAAASDLAASELRRALQSSYLIRGQKPLTLNAETEPEPDIAVVRGSARDYVRHHPTTALLVVEVADSSLASDQRAKAELYARADIPEYWVLNLPHRQLEVSRDPDPVAGQYRTTSVLAETETVSPLAAPSAIIAVRDLLP